MKCMYCQGEIEADAKKCKHCGEWLKDKPQSATEKISEDKLRNQKQTKGCCLITVVGLVIWIIVIAASSNGKPSSASSPSPPTVVTKAKIIYDVPSLVGKNIDEVREALGKPQAGRDEPTSEQLSLGFSEWDNQFGPDDKALLVTFNPQDRKIIDFFISTDDPSGATKDKDYLLALGNLKENDPNYKIEFVKAVIEPTSFTGVKVIPRR